MHSPSGLRVSSKWPYVVRGSQSTPNSGESPRGTGKAGENGQYSVLVSGRPHWTRPSVGYRPEAGNDYTNFQESGSGPGGLIAIDLVTGRSHVSREAQGKAG